MVLIFFPSMTVSAGRSVWTAFLVLLHVLVYIPMRTGNGLIFIKVDPSPKVLVIMSVNTNASIMSNIVERTPNLKKII